MLLPWQQGKLFSSSLWLQTIEMLVPCGWSHLAQISVVLRFGWDWNTFGWRQPVSECCALYWNISGWMFGSFSHVSFHPFSFWQNFFTLTLLFICSSFQPSNPSSSSSVKSSLLGCGGRQEECLVDQRPENLWKSRRRKKSISKRSNQRWPKIVIILLQRGIKKSQLENIKFHMHPFHLCDVLFHQTRQHTCCKLIAQSIMKREAQPELSAASHKDKMYTCLETALSNICSYHQQLFLHIDTFIQVNAVCIAEFFKIANLFNHFNYLTVPSNFDQQQKLSTSRNWKFIWIKRIFLFLKYINIWRNLRLLSLETKSG